MKKPKRFSPHIHPFRVHVPNLLNETFINACRPKDLVALKIPLNEFVRYLRTLTGRCAELNDPVLNKIMIDMTLYEESDPASREFNQGMVDQVNNNYDNYLIKTGKNSKA
ncbi:MAG: hypothetical protein ACI8Q1_000226 [Parvicella sp.]|jgi:hypothetical protein